MLDNKTLQRRLLVLMVRYPALRKVVSRLGPRTQKRASHKG